MRFCLPGRFLPVSVCVTQILVGGAAFPPPPGPTRPPTLISISTTHLSWQWDYLPTDLWAIQPTCREVTDFKKAVSQRVKKKLRIMKQKLMPNFNRARIYKMRFPFPEPFGRF
jgi:hypothetical protein